MADKISVGARSELMSKIKSQNTKCELIVYDYLKQNKIYFQKHYRKIIGKPDIALPQKRVAVFIDGDFWHARKYKETIARIPSVYWKEKISRNVERDIAVNSQLDSLGWIVMRVWESDITRQESRMATLSKIKSFLLDSWQREALSFLGFTAYLLVAQQPTSFVLRIWLRLFRY